MKNVESVTLPVGVGRVYECNSNKQMVKDCQKQAEDENYAK